MSDDIADKMPDLPYDQLIQWCVDVRLGTIKGPIYVLTLRLRQ